MFTSKNLRNHAVMTCFMVFFFGLSALCTESDSTKSKNDDTPPVGIFKMMNDLSTGKADPKDAIGNYGYRSNSGTLSASPPKGLDKVQLAYFSIVPKTVTISTQNEAAYKGVLEEARISIASKYNTILDTTKISSFSGDIKLKVFVDKKGIVSSTSIEQATIKNKTMIQYTTESIKSLDFSPVHKNPKIKGMIFRFSFNPLAERR